MVQILHFFQFLILYTACVVIRPFPFRWAMAGGCFVGRILYLLLAERRKLALDNLRQAFRGEKTEAEIQRIAVESFENLGMLGVEFIFIPKILKRAHEYLRFDNAEKAWKALEGGKGVIFSVSHFGNWEWMAVSTGLEGFPMHAVARPLRNPFVYAYIKKMRGITGLKSIDKKGAARETIKLLAQNQIVSVLIDQHERQGGVRVPFFGREASTTSLAAILAVKKGIPVIPIFFYREDKTPSLVFLGDPFPVIRTGDYERDLYENTKQYLQAIEEQIRKRPGAWLWMHRRWR